MDSYRKIARKIPREIRLETLGKPRSIAEDVTEVVQVIEDGTVANKCSGWMHKQSSKELSKDFFKKCCKESSKELSKEFFKEFYNEFCKELFK